MDNIIYVNFATLSPKPDALLWTDDELPDNVISFEDEKTKREREKSDVNPNFTPGDLQKLEYFSTLLDYPGLTSTTINSHFDKVVVPQHLLNKTNLRLNWSYSSGISGFKLDQWGVRGELNFGKDVFFVEIPWEAIWQVSKADDPAESLMIWETSDVTEKNEND